MRKITIALAGAVIALVTALFFQHRTSRNLQQDLALALTDNAKLRQELSNAQPRPTPGFEEPGANALVSADQHVRELESEVLRLRGASSRAALAEAELAQIKSQPHGSEPASPAFSLAATDSKGTSEALLAYLGDPVFPPPNLPAAYSKDGLLNAVQQAAKAAGVPLKRVEIETSEFPYLAGVVCNSDEDFEKLKEQFKKVEAYEYGGSVSSHGVYSFTLVPHRAYPPDSGGRIGRRTLLRQQMFFDQLTVGAN